jgi:hypothetical protein
MRSCNRGAERFQIHMDDPSNDRSHSCPEGEHVPSGGLRIVRRTQVTVEREITTIVFRRRNESSEDAPQPESPARENHGDDPRETR